MNIYKFGTSQCPDEVDSDDSRWISDSDASDGSIGTQEDEEKDDESELSDASTLKTVR